MNRDDKTLLAGFAVGSIFVPLVFGVALGWPTWLWVLLIVGLLTATGLIGRQILNQRDRERQALYGRQRTAEPEYLPPAQHPISDAPLPSAEKDYRFLLSATVYWHAATNTGGLSSANQLGLAVDSVLERARRVTGAQSPDDHVGAQYKLAAALSVRLPDFSRQVLAWADNIVLTVPEDDARRLAKLAELRKREQVWEHERGFERNMRAYLGQEVLQTPGSAVVWWLARHTDDVQETVSLIGSLAQLAAAANNSEVHEQFRHLVPQPADPPPQSPQDQPHPSNMGQEWEAPPSRHNGATHTTNGDPASSPERDLAHDLFPDPDAQTQRKFFAHDLAKIVDAHGIHEQAQRIRDTFDVADPHVPDEPIPGDTQDPGGPSPAPTDTGETDQR